MISHVGGAVAKQGHTANIRGTGRLEHLTQLAIIGGLYSK